MGDISAELKGRAFAEQGRFGSERLSLIEVSGFREFHPSPVLVWLTGVLKRER